MAPHLKPSLRTSWDLGNESYICICTFAWMQVSLRNVYNFHQVKALLTQLLMQLKTVWEHQRKN